MESILHIQPITRKISNPMTIGHTDYISFGEMHLEGEEDPLGEHAAQLRVGCPLEEIDHGSQRSHVPLVKTFEMMPDTLRGGGNVYLETLHYFKDEKFLIPIRTKIQSGYHSGTRLSHLPSLNYIRKDVCGINFPVHEVRSTIVSELLDKDSYFVEKHNEPVMDWVRNDLNNHLSLSTMTDAAFCAKKLETVADRFRSTVARTPFDLRTSHYRDILSTIDIGAKDYPSILYSPDVVAHSAKDVERFMVSHPFDLRSHGRINLNHVPGLVHDHPAFKEVCDIIDRIPLTDFNIDVIFSADNNIVFKHEHYAIHRLAEFKDHNIGAFSTDSLLGELVNDQTIHLILKLFFEKHPLVTDETRHILRMQPVKLKLIKTIEDEACILLYKYNSSSKEDPLCGVHFDIAVQSMAPVTTLPEAIYG